MMEYLLFLVLGLGTGALYAGLAQGVLIAYRGSGVVNLAQGAVAMYGAYTFNELRDRGRLVVPPLPNPLSVFEGIAGWFGFRPELPDLPTFVSLADGPLPIPVSMGLALAVSALLGLAMHVLVFRPLRSAPPLAKTVAAVGLILVLQAIIALRFGSDARPARPVLPNRSVRIFDGIVKADRLWLALIVVLVGVGLWALFRFTILGLASRAAAQNEKGAVLLGYSPDRLAMIGWILSSVLAGLVGILAAPIATLSPGVLTLLVIPALGAVLVARFHSVAIATATALVMGMVDQLIILLERKPAFGWLPSNGTRELVPLLVIVVALFVGGKTLPVRGALEVERLPRAPEPRRPIALAGGVLLVSVLGQFVLGYEWRQALAVSSIGAIIALSLLIVTGLVGQISLAQMAVAGCSAFLLTRLATDWGVPFPLAPLLAAGAAAGVGLLVALPALRIRGITLAVVTLSFAYAVDQVVFNNRDLVGVSGSMRPAPPPSLFGYRFGPLDHLGQRGVPAIPFGIFVAVVLVVCLLLVSNLRRGEVGRRMLAVRANERAAASVGVDIVRTKLVAFALSAFVAGIGGSLLAYQNGGRVEPSTFAVVTSLTALAMAYLGGISTVGGSLTAGILTAGGIGSVVLDKVFHMGAWEYLAAGVLLVLTAVLNPEGVAAAFRHIGAALRGRIRRPAPISVPTREVAT